MMLVGIGQVSGQAQTFRMLHHFSALTSFVGTNEDGANPMAKLLLAGKTLYGTTEYGGPAGNGTIFKVDTDGTSFTVLHSFSARSNGINSDGALPQAGLILSGSTLYGTAYLGGSSNLGTVFAISTNGTGFTALHNFTGNHAFTGISDDGASPQSRLALSGKTLYGTTSVGGIGFGTVFKLNVDGTGFTNLYSFTSGLLGANDGANPNGLVLLGNSLYGTTAQGGFYGFGNSGDGTIFKISTNGTGYTTLHTFTGKNDGGEPLATLILAGNALYGTSYGGGNSGNGTVFSVNTNGTGFATLYNFTASSTVPAFNSDGASPHSELILSSNTLYGTTIEGGTAGYGTVFRVALNGAGFTVLHTFIEHEGNNPWSGLVLSGDTLYGTTRVGGSFNSGTVFSISLSATPPQLALAHAGGNVLLQWPTNSVVYTLQYTTNLASPLWTTNLPSPVVVNGQYTVTNPISGAQQFFRLSQ
jgi:uncharacterized repeat protein (TIGR03803 family)